MRWRFSLSPREWEGARREAVGRVRVTGISVSHSTSPRAAAQLAPLLRGEGKKGALAMGESGCVTSSLLLPGRKLHAEQLRLRGEVETVIRLVTVPQAIEMSICASECGCGAKRQPPSARPSDTIGPH